MENLKAAILTQNQPWRPHRWEGDRWIQGQNKQIWNVLGNVKTVMD